MTLDLRSESPPLTPPEMNYIMDIPEEIREQIYKHIPQKQAVAIRRVCQLWREEIDKFYMFDLHLNSQMSKEALARLVDSQIKYLKIGYFGKQLLTPIADLVLTRKTFFQYPNLLQRMKISSLQNITEHNYWLLLHEVGQSLEDLHVNFNRCWDNDPNANMWHTINFPSLKCVYLKDSRCSHCRVRRVDTQHDIFLNTVDNITSSPCQLTSLTLKVKVKQKLDSEFNITSTSKIPERILTSCANLVRKQDKLEYLKLDQILSMRNSQMNEILLQNSGSLSHLQIYFRYDRSIKSKIFDASILEYCEKLKELYLVLPWPYYRHWAMPDVVNFKLPPSIEHVCFSGFRIPFSDLKPCFIQSLNDIENLPRTVCVYGGAEEDVGREGWICERACDKRHLLARIILSFNGHGLRKRFPLKSVLKKVYFEGSIPMLVFKRDSNETIV